MFGSFDKINKKRRTTMAKFYLLYEDEGKLKFYNKQDTVFNDISEIDLLTIDYSKEGFIKMLNDEYQINIANNNILIAKVTLNKESKSYNISLYNPLFQPSQRINRDKLLKIKYVMLNRLDKIINHEKIKLIDDSSKFHSLINSLCLEILNDKNLKMDMAESKLSSLNLKIKEELVALYGSDYNFHVANIWTMLRSYMDFRNFLLEYINSNCKDLKQDFTIAENYLFPSEIFDYEYSFYIGPYEASLDNNKMIDENYLTEELDTFSKLQEIKRRPFDDEAIGQVFKKYGISEVMNNFEANRIYSSTLEDLLRLGIISDNEYLNRKKVLNNKM